VTFEEWWVKYCGPVELGASHLCVATAAWQAAQQSERERTTAIMLKHLAQWNVPWSDSVEKAVKEINELDT
jgi:hypothetical protein